MDYQEEYKIREAARMVATMLYGIGSDCEVRNIKDVSDTHETFTCQIVFMGGRYMLDCIISEVAGRYEIFAPFLNIDAWISQRIENAFKNHEEKWPHSIGA